MSLGLQIRASPVARIYVVPLRIADENRWVTASDAVILRMVGAHAFETYYQGDSPLTVGVANKTYIVFGISDNSVKRQIVKPKVTRDICLGGSCT